MAYHKTRSRNHDYRSRCIYLITINKSSTTPVLSTLFGVPRSALSLAGVRTTPYGDIVKEQLRRIPVEFPEARILQYIVMPDHIHFVIQIKQPVSYHLGELIGRFTGNCTRRLGVGALPFFEPGFHDRILRDKGQLDNMIKYLRDNPRRLLIKRDCPGYFGRPIKIAINGISYCAYGNFLLLRNPVRSAVRISRTFSEEEHMRHRIEWEETVRGDGVLVSPFISPLEKEIRDYAI